MFITLRTFLNDIYTTTYSQNLLKIYVTLTFKINISMFISFVSSTPSLQTIFHFYTKKINFCAFKLKTIVILAKILEFRKALRKGQIRSIQLLPPPPISLPLSPNIYIFVHSPDILYNKSNTKIVLAY